MQHLTNPLRSLPKTPAPLYVQHHRYTPQYVSQFQREPDAGIGYIYEKIRKLCPLPGKTYCWVCRSKKDSEEVYVSGVYSFDSTPFSKMPDMSSNTDLSASRYERACSFLRSIHIFSDVMSKHNVASF